jgi:hypothetical protein
MTGFPPPAVLKKTEHVLDLAKARVVSWYGETRPHSRAWLLGPSGPPTDDNPRFAAWLLVREGSPPKGYVILTPHSAIAVDAFKWRSRIFGTTHDCKVEFRREHALLRQPLFVPAVRSPTMTGVRELDFKELASAR